MAARNRKQPATTMSEGRRLELTGQMMEPPTDFVNPQYTFSTTHDWLLLALASGVVDAQGAARREMANRGLDAHGESCSFDAARAIWMGPAEAPGDIERAQRAAHQVAADCLKIDLRTQGSDGLDFHDVAVWALREALVAAYQAGRAARD